MFMNYFMCLSVSMQVIVYKEFAVKVLDRLHGQCHPGRFALIRFPFIVVSLSIVSHRSFSLYHCLSIVSHRSFPLDRFGWRNSVTL